MQPAKTPAEALIEAAKKGDVEKTRKLLDGGANPDGEPGSKDWTPLCAASYRGHSKTAALLLAYGADPNLRDRKGNRATPLWWAVSSGNDSLIRTLLKAGADPEKGNMNDMLPLSVAVAAGRLNIVQALIEHSAATDGKGANINAADKAGMTALMRAAIKNDTCVMKLLLDNGADIMQKNIHGLTVLDIAVERNSEKAVSFLLSNKKRAAALLNETDNHGDTALVRAILKRNLNMVSLLLGAGADTEIKNSNGRNALHWAAVTGQTDIAELLLDYNASLTHQENDGNTPLHFAGRSADTKMIETLLCWDAATLAKERSSLRITNDDGLTAKDMARSHSNGREAVKLFTEWEAGENSLRREFATARLQDRQNQQERQRHTMRQFLRRPAPSNGG
jgi:ankyrin repeat protein